MVRQENDMLIIVGLVWIEVIFLVIFIRYLVIGLFIYSATLLSLVFCICFSYYFFWLFICFLCLMAEKIPLKYSSVGSKKLKKSSYFQQSSLSFV
jgi:hypothetical protein